MVRRAWARRRQRGRRSGSPATILDQLQRAREVAPRSFFGAPIVTRLESLDAQGTVGKRATRSFSVLRTSRSCEVVGAVQGGE